MHIPDGFLSTPVWAALDVASAPAIGYMAKRASSSVGETRAPLLGVLGAFVFAAQMINFPIAPGTSAHLLGGGLLAFTAGPAAATIVMSAVLIIQALIFQDGGILALGANIFNLAIMGVLAAYLPYWILGRSRTRTFAIFAGAALSVIVSGSLALCEIVISGILIPQPVLTAALVFFAVSATVEGALTVLVVRGIERINPAWVMEASPAAPVTRVLAVTAVILGCGGFLLASALPDSLERIAEHLGISERETVTLPSPFADYQFSFFASETMGKIAAAVVGLILVYLLCTGIGKVVRRRNA